jgi:hypothetical protein
MMRIVWSLLGLGLVLVVLSWIWPSVVGPGIAWSDAQATEHAKASAHLHYQQGEVALHAVEHGRKPDLKAIAEARERYEASQAKLQAAQRWRSGVALWLQWTGLLLAAVGLVGYFAVRRRAAGQ